MRVGRLGPLMRPPPPSQLCFDTQRKVELKRAEEGAMWIHHDQMHRAHNRYAVSRRHAAHMEAVKAEDLYLNRVHQLPTYVRSLYRFQREFPEWNEGVLATMKSWSTKVRPCAWGGVLRHAPGGSPARPGCDKRQFTRAAQADPENAIMGELDESMSKALASEPETNPLDELISPSMLPGVEEKSDFALEQILGVDMLQEAEDSLPVGEGAGDDPLELRSAQDGMNPR